MMIRKTHSIFGKLHPVTLRKTTMGKTAEENPEWDCLLPGKNWVVL